LLISRANACILVVIKVIMNKPSNLFCLSDNQLFQQKVYYAYKEQAHSSGIGSLTKQLLLHDTMDRH